PQISQQLLTARARDEHYNQLQVSFEQGELRYQFSQNEQFSQGERFSQDETRTTCKPKTSLNVFETD
ncbi:MAG: hypothetical protein LBI71_03825, partial [Enterobacteriaceae bacterium]|nr:hypothetical protein [Enterobacteriaceae bacterium]